MNCKDPKDPGERRIRPPSPKIGSSLETMSNKIVSTIKKYNVYLPIYILIKEPWSRLIPDKEYLKLRYRFLMKRKLNLDNPKRYTEKLQWIKLYDRKPLYSTLVDKYEVKEYVAKIIGDEYIIPTLGVWDKFEDIDFDTLPDQFVLKCTHDSGGIVICRDKKSFDTEAARETINSCMKHKYYYRGREWPYKNVKPRIIAEKYMEDAKTSELRDYKFFCFDGQVKALFIATDRQKKGEETKFDFYDADFNHLDIRNGHPNADPYPEKPATFEEMKVLASKLSKGFRHLRVDFYEVNGKVYFGELTFTHWSGMVPFEPDRWDYIFGEWIRI